MKPALAFALAALAMAGCSVQKEYRDADAATYRAFAPAHKAYVLADPNLTAEQKARRIRTLGTWALRIREAGADAEDP